jgi:hypothetical protein
LEPFHVILNEKIILLSFFQYQEIRRRRNMRIIFVGALSLILLTALGIDNIACAQDEIVESLTGSVYTTVKILPMTPRGAYGIWESYGVVVSDTGEGLFHGVTNRCAGAWFFEKGSWEGEGYCSYTMKDGEKIFLSLKNSGKSPGPPPHPPSQLTGKFIGGTGKYSVIQGEVEATSYDLRSSSEGASQGYNKSKIRYRLPK